jgi:PAS domain S-box-containing protein
MYRARRPIEAQMADEIKALKKRIAELEKLEDAYKRAAEEARRFETVVRDSNDSIIIQDLNGRITAWNRGAELMYGYSEKEALGMNIERLTPPGKLAEHKEFSRRLIAGEAVTSFETQRVTKDGRIIDVWLTVTKVLEKPIDSVISTGRDITNPIGIALIERNISERKKAEDTFKAIFDNAANGILLADTESMKFYKGNPGICRMLGYNADELSELGIKDIHTEKDLPYVTDQFERLAKKEFSLTRDIPFKRKDGTVFFADVSASFVTLTGKKYIMGLFYDVTERKKAEDSIRVLNEQQQTILDSSPIMIFYKDKENRFIRVNEALARAIGKSKQEMEGKTAWDLYPKEEADNYWKDDTEVIASGKPKLNIVESMETPKGTMLLQTDKILYRDSKGEIIGIIGFTQDITDRKKAEERLKESEGKYRTLIENAGETILVAQDERFKFINDKVLELLGYRPEELVGKPFINYVHSDDRNLVGERYVQSLNGEAPPSNYSFRVINKVGKTKWVQMNSVRIDWQGKPATLNFLTDITENKLGEIELRTSEARYRSLFDSSNDILVQIDTSMNLTDINYKAEEISGYKNDELVGKSIGTLADKFTPQSLVAMLANFAKRKLGFPVKPYEVEAFDTHRNKLSFEINAVPIKDGAGRDIGEMAILHDITERKKAEEELRVNEKKYRGLFENSQAGILRSKIDGATIVEMNKKLCEMFGYSRDELLGAPSTILWSDAEKRKPFVKQLEEKGRVADYEAEFMTKNGEVKVCLISASLFPEEGVIEGTIFDITEIRKLDRLKDDFVAMVSHELRTPLTVIQGILANFLDGIEGEFSEKQKHYLVVMNDDVLRLSRIIKEILNLSKLEAGALELHRSETNIEALAKKCAEMLSGQATAKNISIFVESPQKLASLNIDPDRIAEVFINLIDNAIKFTPEGGKISVRISGTKDQAEVSVTDTGIGIEKDQIPRLFSKFFQIGRNAGPGTMGTGLGLAICREIIGLHDGRIWAKSEPGKGSVFTFTLPNVPVKQKKGGDK